MYALNERGGLRFRIDYCKVNMASGSDLASDLAPVDEYKIVLLGDSCSRSMISIGFEYLGTPISRSKTVFRLNILFNNELVSVDLFV